MVLRKLWGEDPGHVPADLQNAAICLTTVAMRVPDLALDTIQKVGSLLPQVGQEGFPL